jgi:hypothetical protein
LRRVHDVGGLGIDVGGEVLQEVVVGEPRQALLVDAEMRDAGRHFGVAEQRADRFTFVEPEPGDVHEPSDVARVGVRARSCTERTLRSRVTLASRFVSGICGTVTL